MKRLSLFLFLALLCSCEEKETPTIKPPIAAPEIPVTPEDGTGDNTSDNPYYIVDDIDDPIYWVTHEYMQDFMEKVTYREKDYVISKIMDFPGGGPGEADIPPTVNIKWENSFPDKKLMLTVWDDEWSREYSLDPGATEQELLNLVPKKRYTYKVITTSGDKVAEGTFRTAGSIHQVFFSDKVRNSRDLGGWKTVDGKTVAYRKLYRGGAVENMISNTGIAEWRAAGIKAELDLAAAESAPSKSPVGVDIAFCAPGFPDGYETMLKDYADGVKEAMTFVAECLRNDKPVFIHCPEGRDQTGTVAILTLGLLGVSEGDISKDYELTYFAPKEWSLYQGAFEHDRTSSCFTGTCEYIKSFGGATFAESVENYLLSIGVTQRDINDIRSNMLK